MEKVTAIDWLKDVLEDHGSPSHLNLDWSSFDDLVADAKLMQKEQMLDLIKFMMENDNQGKSIYDLYQQFEKETYGK